MYSSISRFNYLGVTKRWIVLVSIPDDNEHTRGTKKKNENKSKALSTELKEWKFQDISGICFFIRSKNSFYFVLGRAYCQSIVQLFLFYSTPFSKIVFVCCSPQPSCTHSCLVCRFGWIPSVAAWKTDCMHGLTCIWLHVIYQTFNSHKYTTGMCAAWTVELTHTHIHTYSVAISFNIISISKCPHSCT